MPSNLGNRHASVAAPVRSPAVTLLDTLTWLVDIPSPYGDEGRIADAVAERLSSRPVTRIGNGLVVGRPTGRPLLLLVGHLDTVPHQGQPPARVVDGRLHGLGASDMKSGLAVILHLLEDSAIAVDGPHDVVGVLYDREEGPVQDNQLGPILAAQPWLADAEFAIVGEPTDLSIEVGCNGAMNVRCRFEGRSAHSARPWLGENAIHRAARLLGRLAARDPVDVEVGGLVYREVMSATIAEGGVSRNVIPKDFWVNVSYRFPPSLTLDEAEARFRDFVGDDADALDFVDRAPAGPPPTDNAHFDRLVSVSGAPIGPKQGWTDVARLAEFGVPAVNYGPGETALAHQVDESVPVANLDVAFDVLSRWLAAP